MLGCSTALLVFLGRLFVAEGSTIVGAHLLLSGLAFAAVLIASIREVRTLREGLPFLAPSVLCVARAVINGGIVWQAVEAEMAGVWWVWTLGFLAAAGVAPLLPRTDVQRPNGASAEEARGEARGETEARKFPSGAWEGVVPLAELPRFTVLLTAGLVVAGIVTVAGVTHYVVVSSIFLERSVTTYAEAIDRLGERWPILISVTLIVPILHAQMSFAHAGWTKARQLSDQRDDG